MDLIHQHKINDLISQHAEEKTSLNNSIAYLKENLNTKEETINGLKLKINVTILSIINIYKEFSVEYNKRKRRYFIKKK